MARVYGDGRYARHRSCDQQGAEGGGLQGGGSYEGNDAAAEKFRLIRHSRSTNGRSRRFDRLCAGSSRFEAISPGRRAGHKRRHTKDTAFHKMTLEQWTP